MKKLFLTFVFAIVATLTAMAQQISVVSTTGATTLYRTLQEAIEGADPGSVIYLPGGGFPISDEVKINKKLTIIGIGHKSNNDNADGNTTINGNLFFSQGSDGSALMGCYMTGKVYIGYDGSSSFSVNDVVVRYCNLNSFYTDKTCKGTVLNQSYIRSDYEVYGSGEISNNIFYRLYGNPESGLIIANNIITMSWSPGLQKICNSTLINNIILNSSSYSNINQGNNNYCSGNMIFRSMVEDETPIDLTGIDPNDVFVNYNGGNISLLSDFHFKEAYKQYEGKVGVYANDTDFDKQLAPVPHIVDKRVDEQTDASGKLNVKIRVKAGE